MVLRVFGLGLGNFGEFERIGDMSFGIDPGVIESWNWYRLKQTAKAQRPAFKWSKLYQRFSRLGPKTVCSAWGVGRILQKGGLTQGAKCSGGHLRPMTACSWNDWFNFLSLLIPLFSFFFPLSFFLSPLSLFFSLFFLVGGATAPLAPPCLRPCVFDERIF